MVGVISEGVPFNQINKGETFIYFNRLYIKANEDLAIDRYGESQQLGLTPEELVEPVEIF